MSALRSLHRVGEICSFLVDHTLSSSALLQGTLWCVTLLLLLHVFDVVAKTHIWGSSLFLPKPYTEYASRRYVTSANLCLTTATNTTGYVTSLYWCILHMKTARNMISYTKWNLGNRSCPYNPLSTSPTNWPTNIQRSMSSNKWSKRKHMKTQSHS